MLAKSAQRIQDPGPAAYYLDHVRNRMAVARQYEALLLGQNRVAYQGWRELLPISPCGTCSPMQRLSAALHGTKCLLRCRRGTPPRVWCPLKTATPGCVGGADLCYRHPELWVVQVYDLPVRQNLLVVPGTTLAPDPPCLQPPAGIAQSETFLKQMGLPYTAVDNTAMAAKYVAESGDPSKAAIASRETADLYGLEVLVPDINTDGDNTTAFIVISRKSPPPATASPCCSRWTTSRASWGGDPEDRRIRLQHGVHQEPPMPHVPLNIIFMRTGG